MSETSDEFKIPVKAALRDIYRFLWTARRDLVLMAAIPVVALTLYRVVAIDIFGVSDPALPQAAGEKTTLWDVIVLYLPSLLLYTMFAVAWHRRYLVRGEASTVWSALRWDMRKTKFMLRSVLITAIGGAVIAVPVVILTIFAVVINLAAAAPVAGDVSPPASVETLSSAVGIAALILFMLVYLRLTLWLPATATDSPFSMLESFRLGRDNSWRLLIITCGSEIGIWVLMAGLQIATASLPHGSLTVDLLVGLAQNTLAYAALAAGITALSVCYDRLLARIASDPLYNQGGMPY